MYIGLNNPRGTNKNPNRILDLLTKVLPKAASGLAIKPWQEGLGTRQLILYLSELRRDFLAGIGITYAVFRIAKSRLRHFGEFC